MALTRYQELQASIHDYGAAAFENLVRCKALSAAIVTGFAAYEQCGPECVRAVPPEGPFDPRVRYGDKAFSFAHREVIALEPVRFGLCLIVGNAEDAGAMWLRTAVLVEMAGDAFDVFVADRGRIRVPLEFDGALEPVFEAVHQEYLETFNREVMEFNDVRFAQAIGFAPV